MKRTTISRYLLKRLTDLGVEHMFGVPGDYVLDFMDEVVASPIQLVGTCNELNAGYAADAYGRLKGLGAVVVTYGVGGFSIFNAVAGAYAEQIPLVVISGAPHSAQRKASSMVHHLTKDYLLQYELFSKITIDAAMLTNPDTAGADIDRALSNCVTHRRPIYLEIPLDLVNAPCALPSPKQFDRPRQSNPETLKESVSEAVEILNAASHPALLVGVEVHRFGLRDVLTRLIETVELPYATTVNGKSALPENHPQFVGVYQGALSRRPVLDQIERADALLSLGVWMTDLNTGGFTAHLDQDHLISANSETIRIKHHFYDGVWFGDFIAALTKRLTPRSYSLSHPENPHEPSKRYRAGKNKKLTARRFYERLNRFLNDEMILISGTGDAICATPELFVEEPENYVAQAYYLSIGYSLPATLGISLAVPSKRPFLLIGDGAFQMTAQELSTLIRLRCRPVIFLLNNDGYVIERLIHDGPYNDIQQWKYHRLPDVFGDGAISLTVETEEDLENALSTIESEQDTLIFVEARFSRTDSSPKLADLAERFRRLAK